MKRLKELLSVLKSLVRVPSHYLYHLLGVAITSILYNRDNNFMFHGRD